MLCQRIGKVVLSIKPFMHKYICRGWGSNPDLPVTDGRLYRYTRLALPHFFLDNGKKRVPSLDLKRGYNRLLQIFKISVCENTDKINSQPKSLMKTLIKGKSYC